MPSQNINGTNPRFSPYHLASEEAGIQVLREVHQGFENPPSIHRHNGVIQVLFVLDGGMMMCLPPGSRRLNPGDSCMIPDGIIHHSAQPKGMGHVSFIDLRITADDAFTLYRFVKQKMDCAWGSCEPSALVDQASQLRCHIGKLGGYTRIHGGMLACVWQMLHLCYEYPTSPEPEVTTVDPRVRVVDLRMRELLHTNTSIEQLAGFVHLSRSQLTRLFLEAYGESPASRFRGLRLNLARELLRFSTLSVEEIGRRCGYKNPSHFSSVFRKSTGQPPGHFRKGQG